MKNRRKILTSLFFASVMAMSLSMGAVAEDSVTSDTYDENSSDYSISVSSPDQTTADENLGEETEPSYNYIGDVMRARTSGGTGGYITVEYGIYERYRDAGGGYNQFMNYGISVKIVDTVSDGSDLTADLTIAPVGREASAEIIFPEVTAYSDRLFYDFPTDYDYINLTGYISVSSDAFGDVNSVIINRNVN